MVAKDGVQKLVSSRRFSSIDGIKDVPHGSSAPGVERQRLDFAKRPKQSERVDFADVIDVGFGGMSFF